MYIRNPQSLIAQPGPAASLPSCGVRSGRSIPHSSRPSISTANYMLPDGTPLRVILQCLAALLEEVETR